jgi:hypothetical protein
VAGKAHFELFLDVAHKPRFNLKAPNGEIICTSESYSSKAMLLKGVEAIKKWAAKAEIHNLLNS